MARRNTKLPPLPEAFRRPFDVWECRSLDGKQVVTFARESYPGSTRYQHEYQKLVGQVMAFTKEEAIRTALTEAARK